MDKLSTKFIRLKPHAFFWLTPKDASAARGGALEVCFAVISV
jgi:hypothetical protein